MEIYKNILSTSLRWIDGCRMVVMHGHRTPPLPSNYIFWAQLEIEDFVTC